MLRLLKSSRGFFLSYLKIKRLTYIQIGSEVVAKEYPDKVMHLRKQPYAHMNEGYVVVVEMTGEMDATDAISDYLRKRTELMY